MSREGVGQRRWWVLPAQLLASVLVIALLLRDAEWERVWEALTRSSLAWLAVATAVKMLGLTLHEVRLWTSLIAAGERHPALRVVTIGYVSGLLNTVLPVRGGDLVALGLMKRELGVPAPSGVAAIGLTGFLEAAVFGVFLLGVALVGASQWEELLGTAMTRQATGTLTLMTLAAVFGSVLVVLLARRLRKKPKQPVGIGPIAFLRETLTRVGEGMAAAGPLALNLALAAVQVGMVVFSFWAILPALQLEVPFAVLAVCGVIGVGSFAAVVLPPSFGAGTAATSVFVLGFFGVSEPDALAYTALTWVSNTLPPLCCGLVPLLRRIGRLGPTTQDAPVPSPPG